MNTSGEVADLMVKEGIQITESAVKLAGLGAKNLAAILLAVLNDDKKLQGKTKLKQLLKSDKPLCILQINSSDLKKFTTEAKKYGVLFTAVADKTNDTGLCDIIARQEDVTKLNYLMEKLGYPAPAKETEAPEQNYSEQTDPEQGNPEQDKDGNDRKNQSPRARETSRAEDRQGRESTKRGDMEHRRPSVRAKVIQIKENQAKERQNKPKRRSKEKSI